MGVTVIEMMDSSLRITRGGVKAGRKFKPRFGARRRASTVPPGRAAVGKAVLLASRVVLGSTQSLPGRSTVQRIRFNVGGARYEIAKANLDAYPGTLLGSEERERFFDARRNEYFLDRDSVLFKVVAEYYRTGNFHVCRTECQEETLEELYFYKIPIEQVAECCCANIDFVKIRKDLDQKTKQEVESVHCSNLNSTARQRTWEFFTNEKSSATANAFSNFFGIVVLLNICAIIAETVPAREETTKNSGNSSCVGTQTKTTKYWRYGSLYSQVFFVIDSFCVAIFSCEYAARLFSAPNRWAFVVRFENVVDLTGILPYYATLVEKLADVNSDTLDTVLTALRSLRILRVTKLARHSRQFQHLVRCIRAAATELGEILFAFLALNIMLSSLTYFAENHPQQQEGTKFSNIPITFWYCIVTMTTLG